MIQQKILESKENSESDLKSIIDRKKILLVCTKSMRENELVSFLERNSDKLVKFSGFGPNPDFSEVLDGTKIFAENDCDFLVSLGGGSAMDVAKGIKGILGSAKVRECVLGTSKNLGIDDDLSDNNFDNLDASDAFDAEELLKHPQPDEKILHLAIPTTAGTGSESTHFAVIYLRGVKYSMSDNGLLPDFVLLEPKLLATLPEYQKKATMLDALCQGIESYWSVNSTEESKKYAREAIRLILGNYREYIGGSFDAEVALKMLRAANLSGQAINISQTTAAHAMSYKITSLYGLAHGQAVAVCLPLIWRYMLQHMDKVSDPRGGKYLEQVFYDLDEMFGVDVDGVESSFGADSNLAPQADAAGEEAVKQLFRIYVELGIKYQHVVKEEDLAELTKSVNAERLKNNPVKLSKEMILGLYRELV